MCGKGLVISGRDYVGDANCVHEGPGSDTLDLQEGPQEVSIQPGLGLGEGREEEAIQDASVGLGKRGMGIARRGDDHGGVGNNWGWGCGNGLWSGDKRRGSRGGGQRGNMDLDRPEGDMHRGRSWRCRNRESVRVDSPALVTLFAFNYSSSCGSSCSCTERVGRGGCVAGLRGRGRAGLAITHSGEGRLGTLGCDVAGLATTETGWGARALLIDVAVAVTA